MKNPLTREKKRKLRQKDKGIIDFAKMQKHFYPELIKEFGNVKDEFHYLLKKMYFNIQVLV